ncbi:hypothetical protein BT96DRAFT_263941 [Gymnopus androsaceus JB14]|uniref:Uncharacterized protein n=1 Tax=Gymnopus androsaceus JB14 TaxID=1447944 RepID=A0A6A4H6B4_9AGAR|nr:hypothetical protein BT96DRAFT_263941 [Gymnopus androsaceus JB14]
MPAKSSTKAITPSSQLRETDPSSGNRKRRAEDDDFDASKSQIYDEHGKTRRINPFKLATRLHPDLVKEMEAYIKPGAIMPNFEIRKELQIRYQVDRRHLYDYFHSRGLRVGKEDRHSNLTRSRMAKAKALAQTEVVKENSTLKPVKRIKITPVKRSTAKPATKKAIKKSTSETTVDNHAPEHMIQTGTENTILMSNTSLAVETKCDTGDCPSASSDMNIDAAVESQPSFQKDSILSTCGDFFQSPPRRFHAVSDVSTAAALAEIPSPLLENFILSGRSTPSLIDDTSSSSCKSPSPAYVQPLEKKKKDHSVFPSFSISPRSPSWIPLWIALSCTRPR